MLEHIEREDLEGLRTHLLQLGTDYCGASEVIRAFLSGRGYGISPAGAQAAAVEFGRSGCSLDGILNAIAAAAQPN
ncbi:MAG TPA: hypothetical protein VN515_00325 [Terriglobales bacterium]|nr:hypothetical protein [Terriglobales bacterium]